MVPRIPDLWKSGEAADHLYRLYLAQLQKHDRYERTVAACRQIRHYAACGPGAKEGLLTFHYEVDALYELKNYATAWRQLRLRDRIAFGQSFDYARQEWSVKDAYRLEWDYAPIHYFLGRYKVGCSLLEKALSFWFVDGRNVPAFQTLTRIYNGDDEPWSRCRVTLANFYDRLGKRLTDWEYWREFVDSFPPEVFRLSGVSRKKFRSDCDAMPVFFKCAVQVRRQQQTSQSGDAKTSDKRQELTKQERELRDVRLSNLFPELRDLRG